MLRRNLIQSIFAGIFICLLIGVCPINIHAQVSVPALWAVAPPDPLLVVYTQEIDEVLALIEDSNAWQYMIEAPMWEVLWAALEMETKIKESHRLIRPSLPILSHLLGQEILLVAYKYRGVFGLAPTLIIQLDRSDDLGEILATAIEVGLDNIPDITIHEYSDYSYRLTEPNQTNMRWSFGVIDNLLVASLEEATLRKVIDLHLGKSAESLATDANFLKRIDSVQAKTVDKVTDFQTTFYINLEEISEVIQRMYPMLRNRIPEERRPLQDEVIKRLDLVQWVAAISNLTKDGLISQSYVQFNPDATASDFLAMLQVPPTTSKSIKFVPVDSAVYCFLNLIDLPKIWEMEMNTYLTQPERSEQILDRLETLREKFNINVEADLFSWMDKIIAVIYMGDSPPIAPKEYGEEASSNLLFLIKTTDSTKAAEGLSRLEDLVAEGLRVMEDRPIEWQTIDYLNTQIHTVAIPDSSSQLSYTVTDEYVLIAMHPSTLKAALDCAAGHTENLSTAPLFQELRAIAPERVNHINYITPGRLLVSLFTEELSKKEEYGIALMKPIFNQSIDLVKALMQPLVGLIQYTAKDGGDGLRSYLVLKVRDLDENLSHSDPPEAKLVRSLSIAQMYSEKEMLDRAQPYLNHIMEIVNDWLKSEGAELNSSLHVALGHYALGGVYRIQWNADRMQEELLDEAIEEYKKAISIEPNLSEVHYDLACAYSLQNKKELAIESLQTAINQNKHWFKSCQTDSDFDNIRKSKEFKELIKKFGAEEKQKNDRLRSSFVISELLYKIGIVLNPDDAQPYFQLGFFYMTRGHLSKAAEAYKEGIRRNPDDVKAHITLGLIYSMKREFDKAIAAYNEAIRLQPDNPSTYVNLGLAYHEKDELDNAIESYKKAINIAPKLPYAHYNLACAYSLQNEKELAIKHLKIAITQDRSCLERCQKDPDFDNIRESEGLKEIISLCDE